VVTSTSSEPLPIHPRRTQCARRGAPRDSSLSARRGRGRTCMAPAWARGVSSQRSVDGYARARTRSFSSLRSGWASCPGRAGPRACRSELVGSARLGWLFLEAGSMPRPPFAGASSMRSQARPAPVSSFQERGLSEPEKPRKPARQDDLFALRPPLQIRCPVNRGESLETKRSQNRTRRWRSENPWIPRST